MAGGRQLRLLLWKDYLIRKRKLVTLFGIVWATVVISAVYVIRLNIDNVDYPTCAFPARALPSAGMLQFLQSFICSVNNECSPMDQYEQIPAYEKSKLTQLQRKYAPLLNESTLDVAASVPDALKLVSTLADVVDQPTFVDISKKGLKVQDLFSNPPRVWRYMTSQLHLPNAVARSLMTAELSLQGVSKRDFDRCRVDSLSKTLVMKDQGHMNVLVKRLCSLTGNDMQKIFMDLLFEINFSKYIKMIGDMYSKLSGDTRILDLGDMITGVVRMAQMQSFVPTEVTGITTGGDHFSYFNTTLILKLMDLFDPTFGDTQAYKSMKEFTDTAVFGLQYFSKIFAKQADDDLESDAPTSKTTDNLMQASLKRVSTLVNNAADVLGWAMDDNMQIDVFKVLAQLANFIFKWLPEKYKHDVIFYSTLLAKLIESAHQVVNVNMNLEDLAYNVTLRNPEGMKVLLSLPPVVLGKGLEALADAERAQILTSRINYPGQLFCDASKIQAFFLVTKDDAITLKKLLCTDAWKNYVSDLITSFGIFEIRNNINAITSLVIQNTLGKDTTDQLYSIDKDFQILQNFTNYLLRKNAERRNVDWNALFDVNEESAFITVAKEKSHLTKLVLITLHGCFAKEVVKQNPILQYKITPILLDVTILLSAVNQQIVAMPKELVSKMKKHYPDAVRVVLMTSLDQNKAYKILSTDILDVMCNGVENAEMYLNLPSDINKTSLIGTSCKAVMIIDQVMQKDSLVAGAIRKIMASNKDFMEINWTKLINNMRDLHSKIESDFPYLSNFGSYNMDANMADDVEKMAEKSKEFWFSMNNINRGLHLSVKFVFRVLDIADSGMFNVTSEHWLKMKHAIAVIDGPTRVLDDMVRLVTALSTNSSHSSSLPPKTVAALSNMLPNLPKLIVDSVDLIIEDNTDLEPIITVMNADPPWPCAPTSLADLVKVSPTSGAAIRALETILCLDRDLQVEWVDYLADKNANVDPSQTWNNTKYEPHIFLKFSSTLDAVVNDTVLVKDALEFVFNDTTDSDHITLMSAWNYAVEKFNTSERDDILLRTLSKVDHVLNSITTPPNKTMALNTLAESFLKCNRSTYIGRDCLDRGRLLGMQTIKTFSVIFDNIATDLLKYFKEINEPNSTILQMLGFTRNTGLYILYEKIPEFIGVLLNSYWDYGFMSQVRRAALTDFWDCEAVLKAVAPALGSPIDDDMLKKVQPYVCPSFIHWISLPRGDNSLIDVVAKPQYYFYVYPTQNATSNYKDAFAKVIELVNYITELTKNRTIVEQEGSKTDTFADKLRRAVDTMTSYQINQTDPSYKLFNEVNRKEFQANIYLTRIVTIVNRIASDIAEITLEPNDVIEGDFKTVENELKTIQLAFKRRPVDVITMHFDVITDVLVNDNFTLIDALSSMCEALKSNDASKAILTEDPRLNKQICAKSYKLIYGKVEEMDEDYRLARQSLYNLIEVLQSDTENITDVAKFLKDRKHLVKNLKRSISYSFELGLPIYLKYLHSGVQHQGVILTFLAGGDWWGQLRTLYKGPYSDNFFMHVERSFEVVEDVLTNFDRFHIVRLLRDVNVTKTESLCVSNITLADYVPDATGMFTDVKQAMCAANKADIFKEIPPLVFASQGYDTDLKLSKDVDLAAIYVDLTATESRLPLIRDGPAAPQRPSWVTEERLNTLREVVLGLVSKESITKVSFGVIGNVVDAGTLFLNDSQCTMCSMLTTWLKQLNLQLFKKQEYDSLLCYMDTLTLEEIHHSLKENFHWDMAIKELISSRNYTKFELNKSMNEFLELVKLHLMEDITAPSTKLTECLAKNVTRNEFGNATMFISVLAHVAKLLRSEMPHLREVEGITELPYLQSLSSEISHKLDVHRPMREYLKVGSKLKDDLMAVIGDELTVNDIEDGDINLRTARSVPPTVDSYVKLKKVKWNDICVNDNCPRIFEVVTRHLNGSLIENELPKQQGVEFWRFTFVSSILGHLEALLSHSGRLLAVLGRADLAGALRGQLQAALDAALQLLMDDTLDTVLYSLHGLIEELHPLLKGTDLEHDLRSLSNGLQVLHQFKDYLLEEDALKLQVQTVFPDADAVETGLSALGLNNTNFWSIAAPKIRTGHLQLKPLFTSKQDPYSIASFVCLPEYMSSVILPNDLDVVTADDVFGAVTEQFCDLDDSRAKQILPVLVQNLNFSFVIEKVSTKLLTQLYTASNLTEEEGATVVAKFSEMAALLPLVQENIGDLTETLAKEPLLQSLKDFSSFGGLLSSPKFMHDAGNMLCGRPFNNNMERLYHAITRQEDFNDQPDQAQLDVLPTDFCRSLYEEVIKVQGGKIMWAFVKPIIMGRILYTPPSPAVQGIIEKANLSFARISKMTNMIHSFAESFSSVDSLSSHREGVAVLQRLLSAPELQEFRAMLIGDGGGELGDMNVNGLFDEFGDLEGLGNLVRKASSLLQCINLNRFQAARDERALSHEAARLTMVNEFSAGLVFKNMEDRETLPTHVEYKIRVDIDNAPTTARLTNYFWTPGPESNFIEELRYFRGFVQIQDLVDKAIIELHNSTGRHKRETSSDDSWAVYTQQMPYPCYRQDNFQTSLYESQALIVAFVFCLVYTVTSIARFVVADKESGNVMLMSTMGVDIKYHTMSWFVFSLGEMAATMAAVTAVLHFGRVLPRSEPSLIFTLLFIFGISILSFCYLLSKLFTSAGMAGVCSAMLYLCTFLPFSILLAREAVISYAFKILVCTSMSSSLCYAFLQVTRLEASGVGAHWGAWAAGGGDDVSIAEATLMMVLDAVAYFIVGWLLDRFFGIKTLQTSITHCTTSSEKAGVSIVNVSKIYGAHGRSPKLALDNVSIELHKGQITTLLGHNGAGKTTLINILTGVLKPSQGHVTIRSEPGTGTKLGVCHQKDVLFEYMTAAEHIALYAQLKSGLGMEHVREEVERMIDVVSLRGSCHAAVARLSGGTRRRLCVALAFVGSPPLVSLDEPTSGVDPAARRDIWSMIMKLKESRTILLTTHHLDEAELLSDQIVIMHKGQVHTTGSPVEIKRTLGNGYKLTVTFGAVDSWPEEEPSIEEKSKQLLALVRDVVRNSRLVDVSGCDVELLLPFYDANGVDNNFLQLCRALEASQPALGYRTYSLDCSSLEQVFFNVCQLADGQPQSGGNPKEEETPSKSASNSSVRTDSALVAPAGGMRGSGWAQLGALLYARYLHHVRNKWLVFLLVVLPCLFVVAAMAFSTVRPPLDNEVALRLTPDLYAHTTQFTVLDPSMNSGHTGLARDVMNVLLTEKQTRNWTKQDSPLCKCEETRQVCDYSVSSKDRPEMMLLPDVDTLNTWLVETQDHYIENRYGGFTSTRHNNVTNLVAWYNNKGHHALPSYINALNNAILRAITKTDANITTYSHPLKISKEQISKTTVYQHVADAGVAALVLLAFCVAPAGAAMFLVTSRVTQQKRLQLLSGLSPALYWTAALSWDLMVIALNMAITAAVMLAFGFPVFVARNNLPAICILFILYGYACGGLVYLAEKLFTEASLANMVLFCTNSFCGLGGIAVLLILDIISESDSTDYARWVVHKIFLLSPQFALGDGLLEIAKNTVQAEVLSRFGMDTYRDPLSSDLVLLHFSSLAVVGTLLLLLNLAIEYDCFEVLLQRLREKRPKDYVREPELPEVTAERERVRDDCRRARAPLTVRTIGNINRGYVHTEGKKSTQEVIPSTSDVAQCVGLCKVYPAVVGRRLALQELTLGIPRGQCTALLGQNGAGKSTTFAMLTGETRPTAGDIFLNDTRVKARQLCQGSISYCPQSDAIDPQLTVRETLAFYCRLRGITEQDEVIKRTLDMFELHKYAAARSGTLSGGNKRKLCTALAFMGRSQLVLLDEPTSGMDPVSRVCVWRGVRAACARARGVLLSTHATDDARRLAARVALLAAGRLRALAPLDACLTRFGGGYVVQCRVRGGSGGSRGAWRGVSRAAPAAALQALHQHSLHFLLPARTEVNGKEIITQPSDVFGLIEDLRKSCDIEDYAVNLSSLDQMFLTFSDKPQVELEPEVEPLPVTLSRDDELDSVTAL